MLDVLINSSTTKFQKMIMPIELARFIIFVVKISSQSQYLTRYTHIVMISLEVPQRSPLERMSNESGISPCEYGQGVRNPARTSRDRLQDVDHYSTTV